MPAKAAACYRRLASSTVTSPNDLFGENDTDSRYLDVVVDPIRTSARYRPKFGQGVKAGFDLEQFQALYRSDQFYSWFGLDNPMMYAAHKAAGGMTSVYRQIGIGCEALFRQILRDHLGLSLQEATWSYEVPKSGGGTRKLSLDGRVQIDKLDKATDRERVLQWIQEQTRHLGVAKGIANSLIGVVFEVRQGYKSKDSKRQNADIANAATAYTSAYLPCVVVLSSQIDTDIATRYRAEKWALLTGRTNASTPYDSTYVFMRDVVGYDLAAFFERNAETLREEVEKVLKQLLSPS